MSHFHNYMYNKSIPAKASLAYIRSMAAKAIVIPTFNRRATLLLALSKIYQFLPTNIHVIVVDSGSSDGTMVAVKEQFPRVILLAGNASMWWAAAMNFGIRKAQELGCRYVITYNDDNVATPDLFDNLDLAMQKAPESIVSAVCCYLNKPATVFFAGRMRAAKTDRFYYLDHDVPVASLGTGLRNVDMLHGMCTLFPMKVFDTVGLFDEINFPQTFADDDLLLKAARAGFSLMIALDAVALNDRTKTGINPYDRRLGAHGILQLLISRTSYFQLTARSRFLWRHRRSLFFFCKTWCSDYVRLFTILLTRWVLPSKTFHWIGIKWGRRLQRR
jgi:GT2 family glycosyltransferase